MKQHILSNFNYGYYYISQIPPKEFWRLFVDGALYHKSNAWRGYESREPGSLGACYNGLAFVLDHLHKPIDGSFIKDIHKQVCDKVGGEIRLQEAVHQNYKPGQYRDETVGFNVPINLATLAGLREFIYRTKKIKVKGGYKEIQVCINSEEYKKIPTNPDDGFLVYDKIFNVYTYKAPYHTTWTDIDEQRIARIENRITFLCNSYNENIKSAKSSYDKLYIIARHIQDFELLHAFPDANGRTFVNLLLNKMLIENGFPPAIFYQPNVFDLYSTEELVDVLKDGMLNTINLIEQGVLFDFPTLFATSQEVAVENNKTEHAQKVRAEKCQSSHQMTAKDKDELQEFLYTTQNDSYKLHQALAGNNAAKVKNLLASGVDINKRADDGAPPLYRNRTPLEVAILSNQKDMLQLLVNHGVKINDHVDTLVDLCVQENNLGMLAFLVEILGLDLKRIHQQPETSSPVIQAMVMKNGIPMARYLLENKCNPNLTDTSGVSTFAKIAQFGNQELLDAVVRAGADTNYVDKDGGNALFFAATNVIGSLINNYLLDVNKKNNQSLDFFDYRLELCKQGQDKVEQLLKLLQIQNTFIQMKLTSSNTWQKVFSLLWEMNYGILPNTIMAEILNESPCNLKLKFPQEKIPDQYMRAFTDDLKNNRWNAVMILLLHMPTAISLSEEMNKKLKENKSKIYASYRHFLKNRLNSNDRNAAQESMSDIINRKSKLGIVLSEMTGMQTLTSSIFSNVESVEIKELKDERDKLRAMGEYGHLRKLE